MTVNGYLDYALKEVELVQEGQVFNVKDLFKGYLWNQIPRNQRLLLGTLFLNAVNTEPLAIDVLSKTTSGQQRYKKK